MKRIIAITALGLSISASAQNFGPVDSVESLIEAMRATERFWATHTCFLNSDVKAATDLIEWQRQRIAELEAKCGAACK